MNNKYCVFHQNNSSWNEFSNIYIETIFIFIYKILIT